jgi:hypothetical protein
MWLLGLLLGCLVDPNNGFVAPREPPCHAGIEQTKTAIFSLPGTSEGEPVGRQHFATTRRTWLAQLSLLPTLLMMPTLPSFASPAEDSSTAVEDGLLSATRVADLLRVVPTFTLVDKKGVPFMVVGEDAKVTGYFFVDYGEAKRILRVARESADKAIAESKQDPDQVADGLYNPWKEARISTVPMDVAVTLITKSLYSRRPGGNYFQIAPSSTDIENALGLTGKEDLAEGKVPLFYYENGALPAKATETEKYEFSTPLYFSKAQLEEAYRKANKGQPLPPAKVTELFALLLEMVKPGGTDTDLRNIVFVPPKASAKAAQECQRKGGVETPFQLGQRNIIL